MASYTKDQYKAAEEAVRSGVATQEQKNMTVARTKQAGEDGRRAADALRNSGLNTPYGKGKF